MARRQETGLLEDILDLLTEAPWWVSVIFSAVLYAGLKWWFVPAAQDSVFLIGFAPVVDRYAHWIAGFFLIPGAFSALSSLRKSRNLDKQTGLESIRALSWKQFEELLGEVFRREGYSVSENTRAGADGGVDLWIARDGNSYLVQAKQWRSAKVGVKVVREMLGLVTAHKAQGAIIITSGFFTQEAKNFAAHQPVELIEGRQLVDMVRGIQKRRVASPESSVPAARSFAVATSAELVVDSKMCPRCGSGLVRRMARKGPRAGNQFWGCSGFPACRYTEE